MSPEVSHVLEVCLVPDDCEYEFGDLFIFHAGCGDRQLRVHEHGRSPVVVCQCYASWQLDDGNLVILTAKDGVERHCRASFTPFGSSTSIRVSCTIEQASRDTPERSINNPRLISSTHVQKYCSSSFCGSSQIHGKTVWILGPPSKAGRPMSTDYMCTECGAKTGEEYACR